MAELTRFYRSRTGQKIIRTAFQKTDLTSALKQVVKTEDATLSAPIAAEAQGKAVEAVVESLTEEDEAAFEALTRSISVARLQSLNAEIQKVTLAWVNEPDPELDKKIEEVLAAAMTRYIEAHEKRK